MKIKLNPVIIAGFDILFLGRKGFSSLAKAREILVRPKGRKDIAWTRLDVSKKRKKSQKEDLLYKHLQKETFAKDIEEEPRKRKKLAKEDEKTERIEFIPSEPIDKVITTIEGNKAEIRKIVYEVPKAIRFAKSDRYEPITVQKYINAVKKEFKKIRKKYGKKKYQIRLLHQYKGLPSNNDIDPQNKGFRGYGLPRQLFETQADIDDQFDDVLSRQYPESFSKYLQYASDSTSFDFIGFMVEIVLDEID